MLVYTGIKKEFMLDVDSDTITNKIYEKYRTFFGKSNDSQIRSWKNSMQYMYKVLNDDVIPSDSGIAIEFNIPTTSKRVDFIISGYNQDKRDSVIIIELKQWEKCEAVEGKDDIVKTYLNGCLRETVHPSYQAWTYANLIRDFNQSVQQEEINLYPCAYLHNYDLKINDSINSSQYSEYLEEAPLFGYGDVIKLRDFIKKYIKSGDNKSLLYKIENGKIRPSKRLQDTLKNMLAGNKEFLMIDDQKVIYEEAISMAIKTLANDEKNVLIVQGGPGTGKTVLAVNLLVELTNRNMVCNYVTKNAAPRYVFYSKLKGSFKASYINNLFKGSSTYVDSNKNTFDVLLVDEAHRLQEKSGMFKNLGENQIKEIINASKLSIFFIDENQRVTMDDIGSLEMIEKYAKELNAGVKTFELESQFRCNGSDGYLAWLDNILEIRQTANYDLDYNYDFKVLDEPNELKNLIIEKNNEDNKSRIVAGYCWDWIKEGDSQNNSNVYDIQMPEYNFGMSWNLANSNTWAIDEKSVNEVGCIHTCQGLEFDYVGVIIGNDLRYENGKIVTDFSKRAKTDQSIKGLKAMYKNNPDKAKQLADQIIKNTYRTLMTRGMKGCYIFACDKGLNEYLKEKIYK